MTNDNSILSLQSFSMANLDKMIIKNQTLINWANSTDPFLHQLFFNSDEYKNYRVFLFFF